MILASATILGLDSEFGPSFLDVIPSPSPIPTLLQVATRDTCLLFDLPALRRESAATFEACGDVLAAAFGAAHVLKLGYAFAEDLKVLRRAYPEIAPRCFAAVASYVELGDVQVYLHTAGCRDFGAS